jgi:glycosyltransferase involved in cell wall biosynthesis
MKKLLILQGWLPNYRKPFFNELARHYKVTVLHSGSSSVASSDKFSEVILPCVHFFGIKWQKNLLKQIREFRPDVVVAGDDLRYIGFALARLLSPASLPWAWWGVNLSHNCFLSFVKFNFIFRSHDSLIFYDRKSMNRVFTFGIDSRRLYLANNTVYVNQRQFSSDFQLRKSFINVGSLDHRKKNHVLLRVFSRIIRMRGNGYKLYLIGDGPELDSLRSFAAELDISKNVIFTGKVEEPEVLYEYYKTALASVSFGQAGLAVLQSMAHGVPFITSINAITGGELTNILPNKNGIICDDTEEDLLKSMIELIDYPSKAVALGKSSYEYYNNQANINIMVDGFLAALRCKKI